MRYYDEILIIKVLLCTTTLHTIDPSIQSMKDIYHQHHHDNIVNNPSRYMLEKNKISNVAYYYPTGVNNFQYVTIFYGFPEI